MAPEKTNSWFDLLIKNSIWITPVLIMLWASQFTLINVDSVRDFIIANQILNGETLPLLGPQMAQSFHIGPIWYYLMAIPALITDSWFGMAVFIAALNALKFFLAYRIGVRLADHRLGCLLVLGLMLISYNFMQQITFTHTNVVETCALLIIHVSLFSQLNLLRNWALLGLLCVLAFHAHPTTLTVGTFILVKWLQSPKKILNVLAFLFGFGVLMLPLIIQELAHTGQFTSGFSKFTENQANNQQLTGLLQLGLGVFATGAWNILHMALPAGWAMLLFVVQMLVVLVGAMAPIWCWRELPKPVQAFYKQVLIYWVVSLLLIWLVRDRTPWYMSYGLNLGVGLWLAIGWYALWLSRFKIATKPMTLILIFNFALVSVMLTIKSNDNTIQAPSSGLFNIQSLDTSLSAKGFELLAKDAAAHGQFTCEHQPVALHGPYAALIHSHSGLEHRRECGPEGLHYGPGEQLQHLIGVPGYFAKHIRQTPMRVIGDSHFYRPLDIGSHQIDWQESFAHDYEKTRPKTAPTEQELTLTEGVHLLMTQTLGHHARLESIEVGANGATMQPVAVNNFARLYVCQACDPKTTTWTISFKESKPGYSDLVSF